MTPRVGVKTTLTNGNAPLGALVPKQGPHLFAHTPFIVGQPILAVLFRLTASFQLLALNNRYCELTLRVTAIFN